MWKEEFFCTCLLMEGAYKQKSVILCWITFFIAVFSSDSVHQKLTSQNP